MISNDNLIKITIVDNKIIRVVSFKRQLANPLRIMPLQ